MFCVGPRRPAFPRGKGRGGVGNKERFLQACSMTSSPPLGAKRRFPVASDKGGWKEPFQAYVRAGAWRGGLSRNIRVLVG